MRPTSIAWPDGRKLKLLYPEQARDEDGQPNSPELQVKLHECFALKEHPHICEGRLPVKLWLCAPDGKRLEATLQLARLQGEQLPEAQAGAAEEVSGRDVGVGRHRAAIIKQQRHQDLVPA